MTIQESMAQVVRDSGVSIERANSIDSITEWKKWLAYDPDFLVRKRRALRDKDIITKEDALYLRDYIYYSSILDLMYTYGTELISRRNTDKVDLFLEHHSIEEYMKSKLTEDELEYANLMIKEYMDLSDEELQAKISHQCKQQIYQQLSMVDAYILHVIIDRYNKKELERNEEEVVIHYWNKKGVRQRNLYNVGK